MSHALEGDSSDCASACYVCAKLVLGNATGPCAACGELLTVLGSDGTFIEELTREKARQYWLARLLDEAKLDVFMKQYQPVKPESRGSIQAYENWFNRMFREYHDQKASLELDASFLAAAAAAISPAVLDERLEESVRSGRRYRCPKCKQLSLGYFCEVPDPR